jgi:hypothetical protein
MPYQPSPGGYCDNQALHDALRATARARDILRRILDEQPARGALYQLLAELAAALGDVSVALFSMKEIRIRGNSQVRNEA